MERRRWVSLRSFECCLARPDPALWKRKGRERCRGLMGSGGFVRRLARDRDKRRADTRGAAQRRCPSAKICATICANRWAGKNNPSIVIASPAVSSNKVYLSREMFVNQISSVARLRNATS